MRYLEFENWEECQIEIGDGWETPDDLPARDVKFAHCSVDVEILIPSMDSFGKRYEEKRKGYYHYDAKQWFIYEGAEGEQACDTLTAWRYGK